jgi:mediator of RNA polymerase II transcription subunit 5
MARSQHKTPPHLDLRRCLNTLPPMKFLQILWTEIQVAANMGEAEICRRIATFVLTTPIVDGKSTARHYPLLPIFLHVVLPGIIAETDRLPLQEEQTITVDLIVAVISSALSAAMHLEWALRSVSIPDQQQQQQQSGTSKSPVLGQTSKGMARRLALDLRRNRTSGVSKMMLQRLMASHPFVANFPVFKSELGAT